MNAPSVMILAGIDDPTECDEFQIEDNWSPARKDKIGQEIAITATDDWGSTTIALERDSVRDLRDWLNQWLEAGRLP